MSSVAAARRASCAAVDGWLAVSLARDDDIDAVPAWLELDRATPDVSTAVAAVAARNTLEYLETRGVLLGLPVAALSTAEPSVATGLPVVAAPYGAGSRNDRPPLVVDLSSLWAGPLCSHLLQRYGAHVIKVESKHRPDAGRAGSPEFFDLLNGGKQSVVLDLRTDAGRGALRRLLVAADVVVEASRPRALEQLGVIADELMRDEGGPNVWISITGHGRDGDAAQRVAFGDDAAVAGGLVVYDELGPCFCADAIADPLSGMVAAAATIDLLQRGRDRWLVDVAMANVAHHFAGPTLDATGSAMSAAAPRARAPSARAAPLGRDTSAVLEQLAAACDTICACCCTSTPTSAAIRMMPARSRCCWVGPTSRSPGSRRTSSEQASERDASSTTSASRRGVTSLSPPAQRPRSRPTRQFTSTWGDDRYWPDPVTPKPSSAEHALDLLADSARRGATIVAIGALTNLALLERAHPDTLRDASIVAMAGWLAPPGDGMPDWGPEFDFNVQCDTKAADVVLGAARVTLVPLPVAMHAQLRRRDLDRLRTSGPIGALLARQSETYGSDSGMEARGREYPRLAHDLVNFHWDPVTAAVAADWSGASIADVTLETQFQDGVLRLHETPGGRSHRAVGGIDAEAFTEAFLAGVETADRRASSSSRRGSVAR